MAVTTLESVVSARAGHGCRSFSKRPTSSAARCCASAALPPLPKSRTLRPAARARPIARAAAATLGSRSRAKRWCADTASSKIVRSAATGSVNVDIPSRRQEYIELLPGITAVTLPRVFYDRPALDVARDLL